MSATSSAPTSRRPSLLSQIRIATPCTADWDQMRGDERMRFCNQCALHVYNISAMTTEEAESLILKTEGRLCVRLFQRSDGTVVTEDCPKAVARVQRRMKVMAGAVASAMAVMASFGLSRDECPSMMAGMAPPQRQAVTFTAPPPVAAAPTTGSIDVPSVPVVTPPAKKPAKKHADPVADLGNVRMIMGGPLAAERSFTMGEARVVTPDDEHPREMKGQVIRR